MAPVHLILGGARSGKSGFGERQLGLLESQGMQPIYVATARTLDQEMTARVARHRAERPRHWQTLEVPLALASTLREQGLNGNAIMVDCLTLWLMNLMDDGQDISQAVSELLDVLGNMACPVILISNEISMGVVPMGEMSRQFVDELGRLHQKIAAQAQQVTLMVAGLAHPIKS